MLLWSASTELLIPFFILINIRLGEVTGRHNNNTIIFQMLCQVRSRVAAATYNFATLLVSEQHRKLSSLSPANSNSILPC